MGGSRYEARRGRSPKPGFFLRRRAAAWEVLPAPACAPGSCQIARRSMEVSFLRSADDLDFMAGVEARGFANGIPADEEGMFQICERLARFCRGFGLPDQARKDGFEDVGGLRIDAVERSSRSSRYSLLRFPVMAACVSCATFVACLKNQGHRARLF